MCFLKPGLLSEAAGVSAVSVTGTTELRAMYGGLQGAIGMLAIAAFFNPTLVNPFLVALITISAGLLLGRIAGLIMDGGYTRYTGMALGFEIVLLICALYLYLIY
jgi:hypothetical protein